MPFTVFEKSAFAGRPFQLYEFLRVSGGIDFFWRYNTTDRDLSFGGNLYKAIPISDSGVRLSAEAASTELKVRLPITEAFCESFRLSGTVPSDTVWLRIRRGHAGNVSGFDSATPVVDDAPIVWIGTITGINQIDEITAVVTGAMLSASFRRGGLRYGYQKPCPHVLYAPTTCRANKELFRDTVTIQAVDGVTITSAGFSARPIGWYRGGWIEYATSSGFIERRMVVAHSTDTVTVQGFPAGLRVGDVAEIFAGCNRTTDECINKFNNLDNYGGFPHSPGRNPFDGNPVFL